MLGIVLLVISSLLIALNLSKHSISEIIPSVYLSVIVFLYPFYCIDRLHWGRIAIYVLFTVLALFSVYRLIKNGWSTFKQVNYIPVIGYIAILFVIVLITKDNYVWLWDSTRLWGAAPKAIFCTEKLQLGPDALVYPFMQSTPPGMPLFVYFTESFNRSFSEWQIYLAYGAFATSLMLPAIKHITRKTLIYLPVLCLIVLLIPCIVTSNGDDYSYFYNSLFIDTVLGTVFGYGLYISAKTDYTDFISTYKFFVVLFSLTILKDTGILFAITLIIVSTILHHKDICTRKAIVLYVCSLLSVPLSWGSWALRLKRRNVMKRVEELDYRISAKTLHKLINKCLSAHSISFNSRWESICISFSFIVVLCIEFILLYVIVKNTKKMKRNGFWSTTVVVAFSYLIFLTGYAITYGYYREPPSFLRYVTTLTTAPLICIFIIFTNNFFKKWQAPKQNKYIHHFILVLLCVMMIDSLYIWKKNTNQSHLCPYESVKRNSDYIIKSIYQDKQTEKLDPKNNIDLYLLYTGNAGDNCMESQRLYMNLIGSGIREKNNYLDMQIVDWDNYEAGPSGVDVAESVDSWDNNLKNDYDYIYVYDIDSRTKDLYYEKTSFMFENKHIYKIDKSSRQLIDIST